MKEKYVYTAEWLLQNDSGINGPRNYVRFALGTPSPEDAIKIILASGIAHQQKGPLANFSGPQGMIYTD